MRHSLCFEWRESDILMDRQVGEQVEMLEDHTHILAVVIDVQRVIRDHLILEADGAGRRRFQQVEAAQEGTFSGSGRTDNEDSFSPFDLRGNIADRSKGAEFFGQTGDVKNYIIHWSSDSFPSAPADK